MTAVKMVFVGDFFFWGGSDKFGSFPRPPLTTYLRLIWQHAPCCAACNNRTDKNIRAVFSSAL